MLYVNYIIIKLEEKRVPSHLRHLGLSVCLWERKATVLFRVKCAQFLLLGDPEFLLRPLGEGEPFWGGLWCATLGCSGGKQSPWLEKWGDVLADEDHGPHLSVCCRLSLGCRWFHGCWESKSDLGVRWDGGNGLCHLSPLYQPCWWGFHFRLPARKKAAVCKTQASGCDLHVTVGGAKPTIGVTHADFLAHQPVCLENPSGWGLAAVSFFFTYQVVHWRKWWSPRGPATAERWSPEKRYSLKWASGLPLWGQFPCGWSERPLWRKRIGDRQTGMGHTTPELRQGLRLEATLFIVWSFVYIC